MSYSDNIPAQLCIVCFRLHMGHLQVLVVYLSSLVLLSPHYILHWLEFISALLDRSYYRWPAWCSCLLWYSILPWLPNMLACISHCARLVAEQVLDSQVHSVLARVVDILAWQHS